MSELSKKSTVYFDPELHEALKIKSAITHQSLSQVVNEAIRMARIYPLLRKGRASLR